MPFVGPEIRAWIKLWMRCKKHSVLPETGALLDQPERIMSIFEVIESEVDRYKQNQTEAERHAIDAKENLKKLHGRH